MEDDMYIKRGFGASDERTPSNCRSLKLHHQTSDLKL